MKIHVDESPAGSGKTHNAIARFVARPDRIIFVTERVDSFPEIRGRISLAAQPFGTNPIVSDVQSRDCLTSVRMTIEAIPHTYEGLPHICVMITHAGFLSANFEGFSRWSIVIDEVPNFLASQAVGTCLDLAYFERFYKLNPFTDKWSTVGLTNEGLELTSAHVADDDSHKHLRNFHDRVRDAALGGAKRHVVCNLTQWSEMTARSVHWLWGSVFSMRQLEAFARVELLGNRFLDDVAAKMVQVIDGDDVEWEVMPSLARSRPFATRTVRIHHFTRRPASRTFFRSPTGKRVLSEIGSILSKRLPVGRSIWSTNEDFLEDLQPGLAKQDYVRPRQAGTNIYAAFHDAALIYSAKPSALMVSLLDLMKQSKAEWVKSVEYETILQFVTRTSVRDQNSTATVNLYVFDEGQADYLAAYFQRLDHVMVERDYIPLPFEFDEMPNRGGRPRLVLTPEQSASRKMEKRESARLRKQKSRLLKTGAGS